jgi:hypothetical protein
MLTDLSLGWDEPHNIRRLCGGNSVRRALLGL